LRAVLRLFPPLRFWARGSVANQLWPRLLLKGLMTLSILTLKILRIWPNCMIPNCFFTHHHDKLVCLDEIQLKPDIFAHLRPLIDARNRNCQFILLGSASRDLLKQSSETLAGRLAYLELTPFPP